MAPTPILSSSLAGTPSDSHSDHDPDFSMPSYARSELSNFSPPFRNGHWPSNWVPVSSHTVIQSGAPSSSSPSSTPTSILSNSQTVASPSITPSTPTAESTSRTLGHSRVELIALGTIGGISLISTLLLLGLYLRKKKMQVIKSQNPFACKMVSRPYSQDDQGAGMTSDEDSSVTSSSTSRMNGFAAITVPVVAMADGEERMSLDVTEWSQLPPSSDIQSAHLNRNSSLRTLDSADVGLTTTSSAWPESAVAVIDRSVAENRKVIGHPDIRRLGRNQRLIGERRNLSSGSLPTDTSDPPPSYHDVDPFNP